MFRRLPIVVKLFSSIDVNPSYIPDLFVISALSKQCWFSNPILDLVDLVGLVLGNVVCFIQISMIQMMYFNS